MQRARGAHLHRRVHRRRLGRAARHLVPAALGRSTGRHGAWATRWRRRAGRGWRWQICSSERSGRSLLDAQEVPSDARGGSRLDGGDRHRTDATPRSRPSTEARAAGASAVKLKVRPGCDLEPVRAVVAAHPDLAVAVDANGSYAGSRTLAVLVDARRAARSGTRAVYIEQPLAGRRPRRPARWSAPQLPVPVALDESSSDPGRCRSGRVAGRARRSSTSSRRGSEACGPP